MSHSFTTIISFVPIAEVSSIRAAIETLGNPAGPTYRAALDRIGCVHFASLNVFEASRGDRGVLVFELSSDGTRDEALKSLAGDTDLGPALATIFAKATDRGSAPLEKFWRLHAVEVSQTPWANPGLVFSGTPGLSVERIRRERALAEHLTGLVAKPVAGTAAAATVAAIRKALASDPVWSWALAPEPLPEQRDKVPGLWTVLGRLSGPFALVFLWPLLPILALALVAVWSGFGFTWRSLLAALLLALPVAVAAIASVLLAVYCALRKREKAEIPIDRAPEPGAVAAIMRRENHAAQNHLAALSVMKPGRLRRLTLVLAFWVIGQMAARFYRPGFLADIGTIHFARWVMIPETSDLLFLSNYGGSWESYLEDFITLAHAGLTGVWSNTVGFPQSSNLFADGATDGERFKRWARRQQIPTAFWYSAYPDLTTAQIRTNALLRQGLGAIMTEDEAQSWLSLFGSSIRPPETLESSETQSLILGGMRFLREGMALVFELSSAVNGAKAFLRDLLPQVAFADGRYHREQATIVAFSASALAKCGLAADGVASFPAAFLDGMSQPWRARALGDIGDNAPEHWWWGDQQRESFDGVLLLYADDEQSLRDCEAATAALLAKHGHRIVHAIPFRPLPAPPHRPGHDGADRSASGPAATTPAPKGKDLAKEAVDAKCEPFGFVDGISQPVIRGSYKALRGADPIHLVEAGEFILGYPDNRGHIPPSPTVAAIHDPINILPVRGDPAADFSVNTVNMDRDLGRNGSFLAIRQLEQDVDEFWSYCAAQGQRWQASFPPGVTIAAEEFIAAKIVGRWRDGSPLVRYPRWPAQSSPMPSRPLTRSTGATSVQSQSAATIPASSSSIRPERHGQSTPAAPAAAAQPQALSTALSAAGRQKPHPPFEPDNDFLLGQEDPQGLRCPLGAHIRRANPRDSFTPGSREQLEITNRHRIIRVGRFYQPDEARGEKKGLFFMCLNGDLERQFEFLQQSWMHSPSFHGLANERDPLTGSRAGTTRFTIPTQAGPIRLEGLRAFVRTRGGGYFFLPSRRTLTYLSS
jgi:deferrochelatase/peroxidase EfeB